MRKRRRVVSNISAKARASFSFELLLLYIPNIIRNRLSSRNRHFLYSFLIIILLVGVSYFLCLILCSIDVFFALLSKVGFSVGGRALSFALCTLGCSGFLASAIAFFVKILISNESPPSIGKMVLPAGTEAGESESSGSWRKYLNCSSRKEIPPPNHPRGVAPGLGGGLIRRFRHRPQTRGLLGNKPGSWSKRGLPK